MFRMFREGLGKVWVTCVGDFWGYVGKCDLEAFWMLFGWHEREKDISKKMWKNLYARVHLHITD